MLKYIGLDKIEFNLNTTSLIDNVQNFFTKGFSDDSDLTSDKSLQLNGGVNRMNYPNSTGTQRRKLPTHPTAHTSPHRFSTIFDDKPLLAQNSSTTNEKTQLPFNSKMSLIRPVRKKNLDSNYSSSSPPPTLSRGASIQSSSNSGHEIITQLKNRKPSNVVFNQYPLQSESPSQFEQTILETDDHMDILSYNSRPSSSKFKNQDQNSSSQNKPNEYLEINKPISNDKNNNNNNRRYSTSFNNNNNNNYPLKNERRPFFFRHNGNTPRDRWLRAYEFVRLQNPNVS
ncbi:unnamed protein product [Brachionus calyciflorus]|uniref:Uncharacterized protein n=1 Tax=Brachionus calyciflorus TaxID=104777 RepID=A0A813S415_9BILA|nr:unnamed protein product [Brachionus calyciflorus]